MKLADLIKNNYVTFDRYRQGVFYYLINDISTTPEVTYEFPVPADDVGNGTLLHTDKAITYMRWLRKAQNEGTFIPHIL